MHAQITMHVRIIDLEQGRVRILQKLVFHHKTKNSACVRLHDNHRWYDIFLVKKEIKLAMENHTHKKVVARKMICTQHSLFGGIHLIHNIFRIITAWKTS
mmetsp:Transcript_8789/g.11681  ORF Transcript_8789/g.11681 Transcript_8789/m.11681 type:complete len:100 (-) Transcript_8789:271-570(-)